MKFSIAIPCYKKKFIRECIDSILAQTFQDFELIIVNDASPENIDPIILSYNKNQIRYYKNEKNTGAENVVDNWNKCLSYARGEYFILMGDDDKMHPDYLLEFCSLIERYPKCHVFHCRAIVIDENSKPLWLTGTRPEFELVYDSIYERMKSNRIFFISDYVYNTEELKNSGGFYKLPLAWASDDITSYIAAQANGIAHTNKPVFFYRQNSQTISTNGSIYLKMEAIRGEEIWLKKFIESEAIGEENNLLRLSIKKEIKIFIQKKKIRTIYSSDETNIFSIFKWFRLKKKYELTSEEIIYALLMNFKEKRKRNYL